MRLDRFVQYWNSEVKLIDMTPEYLEWLLDELRESLGSQFITSMKRPRSLLSMSKLGKPGVLLAVEKLGMSEGCRTTKFQTEWTFSLGHFFEAYVLLMLLYTGHKIDDLQKEVEFKGIPGHIDAVLDGKVLIEIKSMSGSYFRKFIEEPNDDRGYLTQANLYAYCCGLDEAYFICLDKSSGQLAVVDLELEDYYIERAEYIIKNLKRIEEFSDIKKYFQIPDPDIVRGRAVVPESMKWSGLDYLFYEMRNGVVIKKRWY